MRNHVFYIAFFVFLFQGILLLAQNENDVISDILEEAVSTQTEESPDPGIIVEHLSCFLIHPLNINSATESELRELHLLTDFQIYALRNYIREHGKLLSVYELRLIYGFDQQLISKLMPFIIVGDEFYKAASQNRFKQTMILRSGFDFNKKAGFSPDTSGSPPFAGKNIGLMMRYEASFSRFGFGFTVDQDAGEAFPSVKNYFLPDFTSSYFEYKGQRILKKIILGDYKASFGQGLILGGYGQRKGTEVLISPETEGIKKYSSASEYNFFRGVASVLEWKNLSADVFFSERKQDASLHESASDSVPETYFSSVILSGLHRSQKEIEKKNVILNKSMGIHAAYHARNFTLGLTYTNQNYNYKWIRNNTAYITETFAAGRNLRNLSIDFKANFGKLAFFGEAATDAKLRMAMITGILADLHPLVKMSLVFRKYQPDYLGLMPSGFGESQGTKNEEGYYLGIQFFPWKYLKADFYADHFSFPYLRYSAMNPYSGSDYLLNLTFMPMKEFTVMTRFRWEKNQERTETCKTGVDRMAVTKKGNSRLELIYEINKNFRIKSRIEFSYFQKSAENPTIGFYSAHDLGLTSSTGIYKWWLRYAVFDIPNWDNRIYAYENDVLYSFSVPAYTSKGSRFILMAKAQLLRGFEISARYSVSLSEGIKTSGSGNDKVISDKDPNFTIQLRLKI